MVQTSFELSNVIGTVYSKGNVEFSADGEKVVSAVGRRVRIFDLVKYVVYGFYLRFSMQSLYLFIYF